MKLDVTRPIPAHLWTTALVLEAYHGVLEYRAVMRTLTRIGALTDAKVRPRRVNPDVLREHIPTIFHRCVELVIEERLRKQIERMK